MIDEGCWLAGWVAGLAGWAGWVAGLAGWAGWVAGGGGWGAGRGGGGGGGVGGLSLPGPWQTTRGRASRKSPAADPVPREQSGLVAPALRKRNENRNLSRGRGPRLTTVYF